MAWKDVLSVLGLWNSGTPVPIDNANPLPVNVGNFPLGFAVNVVNDSSAPVPISDSGEVSYAPGLFGSTVTASGDTIVYTATPGMAFRIRSTYAVPVVRGSEDPPVITIKILDASNVVVATPYVVAAISKRKIITGPVNGKIAVNLDIAGRVPVTFDVEEF